MDSIYLDYAAATPLDDKVYAAMQPYFREQFYNPSAVYLAGKKVRQLLEGARSDIASHLGCRPAEVVFTAGATEANNLAIQGVVANYPGKEVLISAIEHESVLAPAKRFKHRQIPVSQQGIVEPSELEKMITSDTVLVSVMHVNNELGTIQPLKEISAIVDKINRARRRAGHKIPLYFHADAAQAGNYLDLHVSRLGVDLMSINGGKLYGPKQSGALYIKAGVQIKPLIVGGGQEFGLRSGTENVAGAVGLAKALDLAQQNRLTESERVTQLRLNFEEQIVRNFPSATINGSNKHRTPHIISLTLHGEDNERLLMQLDEAGIVCAVGSACSASRGEPSHVLAAIGLSDDDARSSLRFSLGRQTTQNDVDTTIKVLANLLNKK